MKGLVIRGSRNIFTVRIEAEDALGAQGSPAGEDLECRIKGKVLRGVESYYNPLAPGDRVRVAPDPARPGAGLVIGLEERRNVFTRMNQKGLGANRSAGSQILAANLDLVFCVTSPLSPPFRPRFLDRALIQADAAGLEALILCNKYDLTGGILGKADPDVEERLEDFRRIGYRVLRISAKTGEGMGELRALVEGRVSLFLGQSGVGKSSIMNALLPASLARVGALNEKYDRGNHTTTMSRMIALPPVDGGGAERGAGKGAYLIDSPGIRRFVPDGVEPGDLILHMREFAPLAGTCTYGLSCTHRTEPGCKILEAVHAGVIHEDRYDSFVRMREELMENKR
ncbi:MAG: ribosome small subunit-dependent GTPase A [Treponema sp.]|nr:ribosome small subunit-dependent GTPase A [Treponema sp.]